jgi:hypothetical protein
MDRRLGPLAFLLAALMTSSTALAFDCSTKVDLPPRPDVKKYSDFNLFIAKIVKYKNAQRDEMEQKHKCPDLYATPATPPQPPETINGAVQAAASSPSAPGAAPQQNLPNLGADQLASTSIITPLGLIDSNSDQKPQQLPPLPFDVLDALNSGDPASKELKEYLTRQLVQQDSDTAQAFQVALNGNNMPTALNQSGNLYILVNASGDTLRTDGTVRTESCLSSGCPFDNATLQLQVPVPGWQ